MKHNRLILFSALAGLSLVAAANGAVYSTNFNSFAFGNITGQDGWSVNATNSDPLFPPAPVIATNGIFPWGPRAASVGYAVGLSTGDVYVSHAASTPLVASGATMNASFKAYFTIVDSNGLAADPPVAADAVRDTFGFRLENSTGDNLFSLFLTPKDQVPNPEATQEYNYISWSTGTNPAVDVLLGPPRLACSEGTSFQFNLDFSPASGTDVAFTASIGAMSFNGIIPNGQSQSIARFGATWLTGNPDNPGSNYMVFDNVSLVPETSTSLLGLLGASLALVRRRR